MPRVSKAEKSRNHNKIVEAAARLFRESGVEMTSVSDVMKAAGLTHGGFYRHFGSKEDLIAAALDHAVDEVLKSAEAAPEGRERAAEREGYIASYLSDAHVAEGGRGCPLAALGTELSRLNGSPQGAAEKALKRTVRLLSGGEQPADDKGRALFALLLGSVVLARLSEDDDEKGRMIAAGKTAADLIDTSWPIGQDSHSAP